MQEWKEPRSSEWSDSPFIMSKITVTFSPEFEQIMTWVIQTDHPLDKESFNCLDSDWLSESGESDHLESSFRIPKRNTFSFSRCRFIHRVRTESSDSEMIMWFIQTPFKSFFLSVWFTHLISESAFLQMDDTTLLKQLSTDWHF